MTEERITIERGSMNELATTATPLSLIAAAIDKNLDTDKLEKLMQLQERWQANEARMAYGEAMAACQAEMPPIIKDKHNSQTNSDYASYEGLNRTIKPIYTKHGFSLSFGELSSTEKGVTVWADCRHSQGHCERFTIFMPMDGVGIKGNPMMTAIHAKGSTMSYAKRNLAKMVFNLAEAGEDQDGNMPYPEGTITEAQGNELKALLTEKNIHSDAFFGWVSEAAKLPIDRLGAIPQYLFPKCVDRIKKSKRA